MSFTPINSSDNLTRPSRSLHIEGVARSNPVAITIASIYLGRGELTKKPAAKGRKYAVTAAPVAKTKRGRTSSIKKDGLNVSKADAKVALHTTEQDISTPATYQAPSSMLRRGETIASQPASIATPVSDTGDELAPTAARPITVYSSKTTMDAIDSTSVRTSVESAKASDGQGFTLYEAFSSTASYSSSIPTVNPTIVDRQRLKTATKMRAANDRGESGNSNRRSARLRRVAVIQDEVTEFKRSNKTPLPPIIVDDGEEVFSDVEMVDFAASNENEAEIRSSTPPTRGRKLNTRDVDELEDYGGALLSDADRRALDKINAAAETAMKPIVRNPFPTSVLDRSPILGVSRGVILRTCFRVGEAMMTGCHGVRNGHDIVIELYARVNTSWREPAPGRKQHFTFKDIFHDNPPYLEGTFELWQQAQLWDLDSKVFLRASKGNGIMCRAVARMRRDGQKWGLDVLNVWEATWEDVKFAAGICTDTVGK